MKKYKVTEYREEAFIDEYIVEANSVDLAKEMVEMGEVEAVTDDFVETKHREITGITEVK